MIDNVVIEVVGTLSERVQEIAFANGYVWLSGGRKKVRETGRFIAIHSDLRITTHNDPNIILEGFKMVDSYSFVLSGGKTGTTPIVGKEYTFVSKRGLKKKGKFLYYDSASPSPLIAEVQSSNCETEAFVDYIEKGATLSLRDFIVRFGINWDCFLDNCKTENQRWENKDYYTKGPVEIKRRDPEDWIKDSFEFKHSELGTLTFFSLLVSRWKKEVSFHETIVWEDDYDTRRS